MNLNEMKQQLNENGLSNYAHLYDDIDYQRTRFLHAVDAFDALYGGDDKSEDICLFSVPGRSELSGNHTDHQHGRVLAGAINRDIIAVAKKTSNQTIRLKSEGYDEDTVSLSSPITPENFKKYSSLSLIAGTVDAFLRRGYKVGGFDAYTTTEVLKGSGISSSAAFEVMIGNILNYLYNDGTISNEELAKIAQEAENRFFGKPCGLMDQMACAIGGFVFIDFENPAAPVIEPINFSLSDAGYLLCIVNTGGNHADLTEDYASVTYEMKAVADFFGKGVLRGLTENDLLKNIPALREKVGDRALLRAIHFVRENERVEKQAAALRDGKTDTFLSFVLDSGNSSFRYLQNVYTTKNVTEQGLSLALAITEGALGNKGCAWRVHGGGFAGTIQAFVLKEYADDYRALMDSVFGAGATMILRIRPVGAVQINL